MKSTKITVAYFTPQFDMAAASKAAADLYRDLWRELGLSFGASVVEMMPGSSVDEIVCSLRAKPIVAHPSGRLSLDRFRHPKGRVVYFFGPEDRCIDDALLARFQSVKIPTPTTHPLWGPVAAGVLLNDRLKR